MLFEQTVASGLVSTDDVARLNYDQYERTLPTTVD